MKANISSHLDESQFTPDEPRLELNCRSVVWLICTHYSRRKSSTPCKIVCPCKCFGEWTTGNFSRWILLHSSTKRHLAAWIRGRLIDFFKDESVYDFDGVESHILCCSGPFSTRSSFFSCTFWMLSPRPRASAFSFTVVILDDKAALRRGLSRLSARAIYGGHQLSKFIWRTREMLT